MATSFEERILQERAKMRVSQETLMERVEARARGPQSREVLAETLQYESTGHLNFALFACPPVLERGQGALVGC